MKRGEVWWAELAGDAGFRPVVILTPDERLIRRQSITIAEVTRVVRSIPSEVVLMQSDGMPAKSVINTDNIHTIPKDRLRLQILQLSDEKLYALEQSLRYSLGIEE